MPYRFVNGIRLRYELWGEGRTPLVLLHGLGSSADDWMLQLPALAPHYLCIPVDLRGHGASDKPPGSYTVALFAADVAEMLRQLDLMPAHILGLSLGGLVAQQLALDYAEAVRSLVLINTFPGFWPPSPELFGILWKRRSSLLRGVDMVAKAGRVAEELFPAAAQAIFRDLTTRRLSANDPGAYSRATIAILRFWPGRRLSRVKCPTLILAGDRDRVVPAVYQARLRRCLPHAQYHVIANSGHASNIDQPDAVNAAVLRFLVAVDSAPGAA
jgi:pimeloyl-ACP methyl ester carboxylesterase